jgi:hypothetical protein
MSKRAVVESVAPPAPPCFDSRLHWREYLVSAAQAASEKDQPTPLIFEVGKAVRFNYAFPFCVDCDTVYRLAMLEKDRCKPDWLIALDPRLPALQVLDKLAEASRV